MAEAFPSRHKARLALWRSAPKFPVGLKVPGWMTAHIGNVLPDLDRSLGETVSPSRVRCASSSHISLDPASILRASQWC